MGIYTPPDVWTITYKLLLTHPNFHHLRKCILKRKSHSIDNLSPVYMFFHVVFINIISDRIFEMNSRKKLNMVWTKLWMPLLSTLKWKRQNIFVCMLIAAFPPFVLKIAIVFYRIHIYLMYWKYPRRVVWEEAVCVCVCKMLHLIWSRTLRYFISSHLYVTQYGHKFSNCCC